MRPTSFFAVLLLAVLCVALDVALVVMVDKNQTLQGRLQSQQQALNSGVLGAQGQQISNNMLQDMGGAAAWNPAMRRLLIKHGFSVPAPQTKESRGRPSTGEEKPDRVLSAAPLDDATTAADAKKPQAAPETEQAAP